MDWSLRRGLIQFDPSNSTTQHYSTKDGLPNNTIYGIVPYMNTLWLSTNGGLSRLDLGKETFENFNTEDGIQSLEFNSSANTLIKRVKFIWEKLMVIILSIPKKRNKTKIAPKVLHFFDLLQRKRHIDKVKISN